MYQSQSTAQTVVDVLRQRLRASIVGRDDVIDGHVLTAEQIGPNWRQVFLLTDPRDLQRHIEQRVGDLAGHHIDFIGEGYSDQHIGVRDAGPFQNIRKRGQPDDATHVLAFADLANQSLVLIDHRYIIVFVRQMFGDAGTDQAGATNHDLHRGALSRRCRG